MEQILISTIVFVALAVYAGGAFWLNHTLRRKK